jgi:GNAT superfamily N-acetyltransferase
MSLHIRAATVQDAPAVAAVRVVSWQAAYAGVVPDAYLAAMNLNLAHWTKLANGEEPGSELLVAEEDGRIVGFAVYGAARPPSFGYGGELHATYWLPEATGKGYGTQMMACAFVGLKRLGHDDMIVWVMEANTRARKFYEHLKGVVEIEHSRKSFEIAGTTLGEMAYGLRPLPVLR